ncbi:MAG: DUF1598 domain-containing protein, partial [Phycisphaeraceae bacterium]|nr:DUF1598 domain-containing protein [Phycisphaeraceae bacterium]
MRKLNSIGRVSVVPLLLLLICIAPARGQAPGGAVAAFDPEGVWIDAAGTLKAPKTIRHKRLTAIRQKALAGKPDAQLTYVSLSRLLAEAKKAVEAKKPMPDPVRYMGGLVKLRYVFVDPKGRDLILAGDSEPFKTDVPLRPLGQRTGRPVLHLDDFVTALRTCGPGKTQNPFGCTITFSREAALRSAEAQKKNIHLARTLSGRTRLAKLMAEAAGPQPVKFFNLAPDNRLAYVCVEADFHLKRLVLGLDPSPIKQLKSYLKMQSSPEQGHNRFWFVAQYDALGRS